MKSLLLTVAAAAALVGCAAPGPSAPLVGPTGQPLYILRCTQPEGCFADAAQVCPAGYTVITQRGDFDRSSIGYGTVGIGGGGFGIGLGTGLGGGWQTLTVECK